MLKIDMNVKGLDKLEKHIQYVQRMANMKTDKTFQSYIKNKCMEALNQVMNERLTGGTTNDDAISLYRSSNHIIDDLNGFIIYNDAKIPADMYNTLPFDTSGYPNGEFSIALAFEYGTGIVGSSSYGSSKGYVYNDTNNSKSRSHRKLGNEWYLPAKVHGVSGIKTSGYMGFEIYRFTADKIQKNLPRWVNEYYNKK